MTTTAVRTSRKPASTTLAEEFRFFRRHRNPRIEAAALAGAFVGRLLAEGWGSGDLVIVVAILAAQPFFEWTFHLYVLHYRPVTILGRTVDFELARKHRDHHVDPSVVDLVFVPVRSLLALMALAIALSFAAFPTAAGALTALATGAVLLLTYEWTHYLIHSRYRPRSRLFRAIWRAHRLHHFKNEEYWFGVTTPAADYVLRTHPDPGTVPTSPTARDLAAR
jgi:sterol desaturase/sphingolipid hydroxylase (fatty acid hydroxylase superfamily)